MTDAMHATESTGRPALFRCLQMLASRQHRLSKTQFNALRRQLVALLADEDELKAAGLSVSDASLDGLIDFLASHKAIAHPNLSVTRNGCFAGSWSPHRRRKLTVVFKPSGAGEWIAIDLDPSRPLHEKGDLPVIPNPFAEWMAP